MLRRIWNPAKKQALIITKRASSSSSPPSSLSSSPSSSSSPSCLMGSQMVDKWPSPLNLRSSAASCTAQLSNIVEGCNDPVLEDKILELVSDETDGGNVDLSCLMQSNCPEPYESHNRAPSHLNMPGGGLRAQDKYLASEIHDVFAYERVENPNSQPPSPSTEETIVSHYTPGCPRSIHKCCPSISAHHSENSEFFILKRKCVPREA